MYSLSEALRKRFRDDGWLLLCAILEHRSEVAEFSLVSEMWGENSKINTSDKFSSLQVRFQSDRPGENSRNSPISPYGGSLSLITCNIAVRLDFDSVCHVILMRSDYERSTHGRPSSTAQEATESAYHTLYSKH